LHHFCFAPINHPSKDVDKVVFFSAENRNILFKHNILCKVAFYGQASGTFAPQEATGYATDLPIAYRRKSFRKMTLRFFVPNQVKLAIVCCFFLVALVSCTRETLQLPSSLSFVRASGVTYFKFFFQTIPDKRVGTRTKFSLPPTFNVDNQVIFAFFVGENAMFSNID